MKKSALLFLILPIIFSTTLSAQKTCIAATGIWSDNELEHPFLCDDPEEANILVIPADVTVTIDSKIDFDADVFIIIRGVLFFDGSASHLTLQEDSGVSIENGGGIETNVSNNSQKLNIGGNTYWTSKSGNVPGPVDYGNTTLPVELASFEARAVNGKVKLHWTTLSEEYSDRFVIEHSSNARVFSILGNQIAAGNTREQQDYTFDHHQPISGTNYYRLRQIDFDGTEALSTIRAVDFISEDFFQIQTQGDFLSIHVKFREELRHKGQLRIFDLSGRLLHQLGLELGDQQLEVDISAYEIGHYILQAESGGERLALPFVKMAV